MQTGVQEGVQEGVQAGVQGDRGLVTLLITRHLLSYRTH